ncbi:molybdopterin molybdotransferase MoeA [Paraoerskovia marina]|uniref:molybdopterin molybdotransferase MoeA n=1 Tax=Paraoerskovia marina TaxID=545619 RepID=UPI000492626C|nr:gephyrin-like molybdotransferase Glp [Paraoerskovia marina]
MSPVASKLDEHRARALAMVNPLPSLDVPLDEAVGSVLAADVRAHLAVPPFDMAAMDGYAVRTRDLDVLDGEPVALAVVGEAAAGTGTGTKLGAGEAVRIMTGAPLPPGADAVVPVERTSTGRFRAGVAGVETSVAVPRLDRAHVRPRGEDVMPGDLVCAAGTSVTGPVVAAAASAGATSLRVHRVPRVGVLATGSELVASGRAPAHGQIPDSNSHLLAAGVRAAGAVAVRHPSVGDTVTALASALDELTADVDLVVTSGGVSAGAHDVVRALLDSGDGRLSDVHVAAVDMRPGRPQALARWRGVPWIAVPGSPVAAFVSVTLFARPTIRRLAGCTTSDLPAVPRVAATKWSSPPGRVQILPGRHRPDGRVEPAGRDGHLLSGLVVADCLVIVSAEVDAVRAGDPVRVVVL